MTRMQLIEKVQIRKKVLGISIENLAILSHSSMRTVHRLLSGEDVKLSTVEKITNFLGLDFAGNEVISLQKLKKKRAEEKALFMLSLVQGTSTLECQGLEKKNLDKMLENFKNAFLVGECKDSLWVA